MSTGAVGNCARLEALLDAWLDGELNAADRAEVERHLEECPNCATLLARRGAFRKRLREAVRSTEAPADLQARIHHSLQAAPHSMPARNWMALAAAVVLMVGGAMFYRSGSPGPAAALTEPALLQEISRDTVPIIRVGLNDHIHCAVYREYPDSPPSLQAMLHDLGPKYADLLPVASQHTPAGMRVEMAHICEYGQRRYVHIVFRGQGHVASLVITARERSEDLGSALPGVRAVANDLYAAQAGPFRVSAFQTPRHLVYLIMDSGDESSSSALQSMTPAVRSALLRIES